jgi:aldehyde dehydrogenase (NAD+)
MAIASDRSLFAVHDPSDGSVIHTLESASPHDGIAAVDAAAGAAQAWASRAPRERAEILRNAYQLMTERLDEIAEAIVREMGKPFVEARGEAGYAAEFLRWFSEEAVRINGEYGVAPAGTNRMLVGHAPIGVSLLITPWNFPAAMATRKIGPALAAGCTVVLKPSEVAPFNAFILADVVEAAGLPKGVFNLVTGTGAAAGEALVKHPGVDMISFTGSTRAGKRISELAAQSVKRVALELGGKSASVILDDADLATAVKSTVNGCYLNSGQTCTALTRMLVPQARYEEAAKLAAEAAKAFTVGDPLAESTRLGPLTSQAQLERVRGYIKKGLAEGAELVAGGAEPPEGAPAGGYYVRPTVFGKVRNDMTIAQEEIFGPVLSIIPYRDEEDAVRIANDSVYGLAGAVWSKDEARAQRVARRIRAGQIDINGGAFNMNAPFGGFKQSGRGREAGVYGLEEFLEYKSLQLKG